MDLKEKFLQYNAKEQLLNTGQPVLLAVSGGVDSTVLCDLLFRAGFPFGIAHCNFQLRQEESVRDEEFVASLARRYHAAFHVVKFDTDAYAAAAHVSIQVAARQLRYEWLEKTRHENGYVATVTAHHLNDNVETVLMNFCKGTGIAGLHGILPKQTKLIRPLLFASRKEIEAYGQEQGLPFVTDSSNLSQKYTRNYFRHTIIPAVEKVLPEAVLNMAESIGRFREAEMLYRQALDDHRKRLLEQKGDTYQVPVLKLLKTVPLHTVVYEIFREFGFQAGQAQEIIRLLQSGPGKQLCSASHRIIRDRKWLIITPLETTQASHYLIDEGAEQAIAGALRLKIARMPVVGFAIPSSPDTACLDAATVQFPLLLRRWRQGDYFYPLGMRKKKKLSRFFIDQKLSLADKEKVWVLESQGRIVWVVGMRIDDRCRITDRTREIIRISMQ